MLWGKKKPPERKPHCQLCNRDFVSKEEDRLINELSECHRYEGVSDICEDCAAACEQYRTKYFLDNFRG